jgi:alkylation response protein AidB-like acyl-CoA dehydrogenase
MHGSVRDGALQDAARALAAEVSDRALEIEKARTLPLDLVGRFRESGLFSMALPAALGGLECEPRLIVETVERMSRADGSTGWTLLIGQGSGFFAWLDPQVAKEMLADRPAPVVAGSMAPIGRGVAVRRQGTTDYRLSGRWPFNSGCLHADWMIAAFLLEQQGDGPPAPRFALLPADQVRILDTWNVAGLRGTASHDIEIDGALVPHDHTFDPFNEPARHPGPLYPSLYGFLVTMMAGFPLGLARRALDELHELAHRKRRRPDGPPIAEEPVLQEQILDCETKLRAARALVLEAVDGTAAAMRDSGSAPPKVRAALMAAVHHAMSTAMEVVTTAFHAGGASMLYEHQPLQRCFRDAHAARQHVIFGQEVTKRLGRMELGLPVPPMFF